jgi:hypothetical protein
MGSGKDPRLMQRHNAHVGRDKIDVRHVENEETYRRP